MKRSLPKISSLIKLLFFVSLLSLPLASIFSQSSTTYAAPLEKPHAIGLWWDTQWRYRVPVTVNANGAPRINKPVEVSLNFTQLLAAANGSGTFDPASLRVLEVDNIGNLLNATVPFQFDPVPEYDATTNAAGTLTFIMTGSTAAAAARDYHIYFDLTGRGFTAPIFPDQVTLTEDVIDEEQLSYEIQNQSATYFYQKEGAAFSSVLDLSGNDWISYTTTIGAGGSYRGIPNMIYPEGDFHPGSEAATSQIMAQGPLKITIHSVTNDSKWEALWEIFPDYARMTLLKAEQEYWFLYEGTPGGALEDINDIVVRSDGTETPATSSWEGDLPGQEWLYFGDKALNGSLFLASHAEDEIIDSYFPLTDSSGKMTVFGFGRHNSDNFLTTTPAQFTIGLLNTTQFAGAAPLIQSAYIDLALQVANVETIDQRAPVFVNVSCIPGPTHVTIAWETDELTTSQLNYGATTAYGNTVPDGSAKALRAHKLVGLNSNTSIHFQITATDLNGNRTTTVDHHCPALGGSSLQSDDFNQCTLDTTRWRYLDPQSGAGATAMQVTGTDLALAVPSGISHDIWRSGILAPRIQQAANDHDFTAEVKFNSSVEHSYQMQGLLVEQDQANFLRFNVQYGNDQVHLFVAKFVAGEPTVIIDRLLPQGVAPIYLRVMRTGINWQLLYSYDGTQWITDNGYRFEHLLQVSALSLFAGNAGENPAHTALIDYFFNTANPISPEDAIGQQLGPIIISPAGAGTATSQPINPTIGNATCGSPVRLTAMPATGWVFDGWSSQSGAISGVENPKTTTFMADEIITANFKQEHFSLATAQVGNGTITTTPPKSSYLHNDLITVQATPDVGWYFVGWGGDLVGETPLTQVQMTATKQITATFAQIPYTIEQIVSGEGTVRVEPMQSEYHYGDRVTLTAEAATGWDFDRWQGDSTDTTPTQSVTITDNLHLTAIFTQEQYAIQSTLSGQGQLIITPNKPVYQYGEQLTLRAEPAIGWQFAGWQEDLSGSSNPVSLSMVQGYDVKALFTPIPYAITPQVIGNGQIQLHPDQPTYQYGDVVTVSALPAAGSRFVAWADGITGNDASQSVTVSDSFTVTARFATIDYTLITNTVGNGTISVQPSQESYRYHDVATMQAIAAPGWEFVGWRGSLSGMSNPNPLLIDETEQVTATFQPLTYTVSVDLVGGQAGAHGGQVTIAPAGPYHYGQEITLRAIPDAEAVFLGWDAAGTQSRIPALVLDVTITEDLAFIANFATSRRIYLPLISFNHTTP